MWIEAIVLGLIIGLLRGGRLSNLRDFKPVFVNLFLAGLLFQFLPFFLGKIEFVRAYAAMISFFGNLLVFVFLILNYRKKGMPLIIAGSAMNMLVMLINSLKMPIYFGAASSGAINLKLSIMSGSVVNYFIVDKLEGFSAYLGKFIAMPDFYPGIPVIGIADILIGIGVILLIQNEISYKRGFFI